MPPEEPTYIEPVEAPLSRASHAGSPKHGAGSRFLSRVSPRVVLFSAAMAVLAGVLGFVFIALPDRVDVPAPATAGTAPSASGDAAAPAAPTEIVPPFRAQQMALARERAQKNLADFVELELKLESDFNVAVWGADALGRIKDRASAADALFVEERFEAAIAEYAGALADLETLAAEGEVLLQDALDAGFAALAAHDVEAAVLAFEQALAMRPDDERALAGAGRAEVLPRVLAALREAERGILRDDYAAAAQHVATIRQLDRETAGLDALARRIAAAQTERRRAARLSRAFAALAEGRHDDALAAFDEVLREDPAQASALAGRQQAIQARTRSAIDELRAKALAETKAEDWEAALSSYDAALGIDSSLQFAREGKALIRERVLLIRDMDAVMADPGQLSSDKEFAAAEETLRLARDQADAGERFAARVGEFAALVARSAEPVPLVLVSDNATEVTIQKVGVLGAFERRELALRPGRYVIVGSRDGCRDVRKEIVLSSASGPVDIRCAERI